MIGIIVMAIVLECAISPTSRNAACDTIADDYLHPVPGHAICTVPAEMVSGEEVGCQ